MSVLGNLSVFHSGEGIGKGIKEFAGLCKDDEGWFRWWPALQSKINYLWVMAKYALNNATLIKPYKLGMMTTEAFLGKLLEMFSFLKSEENAFEKLTNAWNSIIDIDDNTAPRLSKVMEKFPSENIYLISNSNELNVSKILDLLRENTNVGIFPKAEIDISVAYSTEPVQIAPKVYLCLSYRYQLFKTHEATQEVKPNSTTSLIEHLIKQNLSITEGKEINIAEEVHLISQFDGDLKAGPALGLSPSNIHHANTFFAKPNRLTQQPTERTPLLNPN